MDPLRPENIDLTIQEEQPENISRVKRSRPPGSTSSDDRLNTLAEGISTMQLGQAQQASILAQMQQWHQAELEWRAGVNAQLADIRATQETHRVQLQNIQTQQQSQWDQHQQNHLQLVQFQADQWDAMYDRDMHNARLLEEVQREQRRQREQLNQLTAMMNQWNTNFFSNYPPRPPQQ